MNGNQPNQTTNQVGQQSQSQNANQSKSQRPTWQESLTAINNLLIPAQEALIILRNNPTFDTLSAGIALAFSLRKIGRKAHLVCPTPINPSNIPGQKDKTLTIPGVDQITTILPQKQLRIVIDYIRGTFSQAGMKKGTDGLMLNLAPEKGESPIEPLNVAVQDLASNPNIVFLVEVENLFHLGDFYTQNQNFLSKLPLVNVDFHSNNSLYGKVNLIDPKATSISEMVTLMLYDLRFTLDEETAKILYNGIKEKTDNFSPSYFSANMLESTSICLRYQQKLPAVQ